MLVTRQRIAYLNWELLDEFGLLISSWHWGHFHIPQYTLLDQIHKTLNLFNCGISGTLNIFNKRTAKFLNAIRIFDGQTIYGIIPNESRTKLLIHGSYSIKIFKCKYIPALEIEEDSSCVFHDWILSTNWINSDHHVVTVTMHNIAVLWTNKLEFIKRAVCEEQCILYSACIYGNKFEDLVILSGTVFSELLLWRASDCSISFRLKGHKGVIFAVDYNPKAHLICTTSDDRSTCLWSVTSENLIDSEIKLKCVIGGHSSRIFRCQILESFIITGGEDGIINIWNLEGKAIKRMESNQGTSIWALTGNESDNLVVVGSGDGSVTTFSLADAVVGRSINFPESRSVRKLSFVGNGNMAAICEGGDLLLYDLGNEKWLDVGKHVDLKSYAVLEVSHCRNFMGLAGYTGSVHIYQHIGNVLEHVCSFVTIEMSRIYSFHWLQSDLFIICGSEGRLQMWRLRNNCVTCIGEFQLPPGKERWSTASCLCGTEHFGVGDRNGNLYLYSFKHKNCIQVIKKAHNYMGVTHLSFSESTLISLGRDSTVRRYHFDPTSKVLCPISSDKLPFYWLASRLQNLVIGFSGKEFVLYDYETRKALLDIDCSGGHRLWDFICNDKNVFFAYTKGRSINLNICNWLNLSPTNVISSFHFGEINAAVCIGNFLISGGEDTMLRISRFATTDLENVAVLKSHLSSIRAITYFKPAQREKYIVFSAGGRSQVISWEFDGVCKQKSSYYEPQEVETRIMDLCIVPSRKDTLLLAACSNGSIKVFDTYNSLHLLGRFFYKRKCIIKITYLKIAGCDFVITAATDGKIVFWNFNIKLLSELKPFFEINSHQSGINCLYHRSVGLNQCLVLTGGDDNKINLYLLEITSDRIKILSSFCDTTSHCAQISGAFVGNKYFLTTSIDQRLIVFEKQLCAGKLCCQFIKRFNIDIPDVHGMCCQEDKDGLKVIVYGKGVQVCRIKDVLA